MCTTLKMGKNKTKKEDFLLFKKRNALFQTQLHWFLEPSGMWWNSGGENECLMKKKILKCEITIAADFALKTTEGPLESKYVLIYRFFYSGWPSPTEVVTPNVSVTFHKKSISPIFCFYFYLFNLCQTIYMNVVETLCLSLPALEECASSWNPIRERKSYIT